MVFLDQVLEATMSNAVQTPSYVIPKEILFADDFTDDSSHALEYARAVAARFGSHVTIVHVSEPVSPIVTPERAALENLGYGPANAEDLLLERVEDLRADGVAADIMERTGAVEGELIAAAKERSADLIILGTHAPHGFDRLFLGSTSEQVADDSGWPVMIVGPKTWPAPEGNWSPERVLCVLEEAECSIAAAIYGVRLSQAVHAETAFYFAGDEVGEVPLSATAFGSTLAEELPDININQDIVPRYLRSDELLEKVLERSLTANVGAIVLCAEPSSSRHTHWHRTFLSKLLADSPCPVIVTGRGAMDRPS
jgi:nucleotide-binding universal stress UspA family protein